MKRIIRYTFLASLSLCMSSCFSCKNLLYSPAAGIDFSNISDEGYGSSDSQTLPGIQAGLDVTAPINPQLSFESGLHFAGKGSKSSYNGSDGDVDYSFSDKTRLNYLDVPLLARYQLGNGGFSVFGGVQPSLLLSAKQKSEGTGSESQTTDVKNSYKSLDMAGSFGVGYGFANGLRINAGYDHGLSNIAKGDAFGSGKIRNRTFKITVGYTFGKK